MALTVEQKAQIVKDFQRKEGDTGSSEVQVDCHDFVFTIF